MYCPGIQLGKKLLYPIHTRPHRGFRRLLGMPFLEVFLRVCRQIIFLRQIKEFCGTRYWLAEAHICTNGCRSVSMLLDTERIPNWNRIEMKCINGIVTVTDREPMGGTRPKKNTSPSVPGLHQKEWTLGPFKATSSMLSRHHLTCSVGALPVILKRSLHTIRMEMRLWL